MNNLNEDTAVYKSDSFQENKEGEIVNVSKSQTQYESSLKKFELKKTDSNFMNMKVSCADDAHEIIMKFYGDDIEVFESFFILLLDRANNTVGYAKISQGGRVGTTFDVGLVAKYAIDSLACNVILAHNHPSGNLRASTADINLTKKAKEGLKLLDIDVLDHLILCKDSYSCFTDDHLI